MCDVNVYYAVSHRNLTNTHKSRNRIHIQHLNQLKNHILYIGSKCHFFSFINFVLYHSFRLNATFWLSVSLYVSERVWFFPLFSPYFEHLYYWDIIHLIQQFRDLVAAHYMSQRKVLVSPRALSRGIDKKQKTRKKSSESKEPPVFVSSSISLHAFRENIHIKLNKWHNELFYICRRYTIRCTFKMLLYYTWYPPYWEDAWRAFTHKDKKEMWKSWQ